MFREGGRQGRLALFATLGFDEKFAVRCLMRSSQSVAKVVAVTAPPLDDYSRSRLDAAWEALRRVAADYAGIEVERFEVEDPRDFWRSASALREKMYRELAAHDGLVLCLSGGLRALVAEALVAAATLPRDAAVEKVHVEVELENLSGVARFNVAQVQRLMQLTGPEHQLFRILAHQGPQRLSQLAATLNRPRSTVYRMLQKLEKLGLVEKEPDGTYKLAG
jgi:CRISPR locus-related DNA-binding protein